MQLFGDLNVYYYPNKKDNPYKIVMHKKRFNADEVIFENNNNERAFIDNEEKLMNNIIRAKTKIRDYAYCNNWEYFATLTFSDTNIDRYDLKEIKKRISIFFNNYKKRKNNDFKYLLIPEFHQDGAVHFHGLLSGINKNDLHLFKLNEKLPQYIYSQLKKGNQIYDFTEFSKRFGYTVVESIKNRQAAANYITKYITKDLVSLPLGTCCYLNSKGLKLPELIHQDYGGIVPKNEKIYENEYVCILWVQDIEKYLRIMMGA